MLPLVLLACSDYELQDKNPDLAPFDTGEPPPDLGEPDLAADPGLVDLGVVCAPGGATVRLLNRGAADLTITELTTSGGWTASPPAFPAVVPPGTGIDVPVVGGPGDGAMTVISDDPDTPTFTVTLQADANTAPLLTWITPGDGSILDVGTPTAFQVAVTDDDTPAEALGITWASDVDGLLSNNPAGTDGLAVLDWDPNAHSSGPHVVTLTAVDACGATSSVDVAICQDEGYLADSLDLSTWHFEGSARWDGTGEWVELTGPTTNQSGTAFQTSDSVTSDSVVIEFGFFVSGGSGADGISLTALDTTRMTGFVGASGGGIGYQGLPGWSVEVDTWYNSELNDPTGSDHVSFHLDGDTANPVAWAVLPEMEDGLWHTMTVSVAGSHATVDVDGITYVDEELSGLSAFPAYVGFTAGTGSATNFHLIDALQVTRSVCEG